ncbi:MAG: protein kinase, partial [Deltaproteobacteria bacterium]|nr:protein kinase [Deltaproteobacteria bacterium]
MTDDAKPGTLDDSLLREIAAAPAVDLPSDLATFVMLEPGIVIDGAFRIEARLGAGGMGVVYAARDLKLDREVAIKLMRLDRGPSGLGAKLPDVFEREARATARLNHPNIVTLHQFGNWNGLLYLVLERLRGETLNARMERGALSLGDGLAILEQVCRALVHTHAAGITHRDLKPQNVFLLPDGGVKVLDFGVSGLARGVEGPAAGRMPAVKSTLSLAGTPGYMAPEQWDGGIQDARTDIFAVGVMLYQLVTGELPFGMKPVDVGARPPSIADKVPELAELVDACLATRRLDRLASAQELATRIAEVRAKVGGSSGGSVPSGPGSLATARVANPRRRRIGVVVAGAAAAAAIALAALRGQHSAACDDATSRAGSVWNEHTRAALAKHFGASAAWTETARVLDTYAGQWVSLRDGACRSGSGAAQGCLDERFAAFSTLVGQLDKLDATQALTSSRGLPPLWDCSDPEYFARVAHPDKPTPRDPKALVPMALAIGGRGRDIVHGATFIDGDLAVAVFGSRDATIAGTHLDTPPGSDDRFGVVARIGDDGATRWTDVLDRAGALTIAAQRDALAIGGTFNNGARVGTAKLPPIASSADGFIASLDAKTGALRWAHAIGGTKAGGIRAVASDAAGNVYASGEYAGTATFGGETIYSAGAMTETAPFIASWSPEGALRWVVHGAGGASSRTWSIATQDNAVVAGLYVRGGGTLGTAKLSEASCVIVRLDADTGAIRWIHQEAGEAARCIVDGVAIHGDRVAISGRHWHANGGYVAELALETGERQWIEQIGTEEHDRPKMVAYAPDGTLAVGGHYTTPTIDIGGHHIVSNGSWDAFVARYDHAG